VEFGEDLFEALFGGRVGRSGGPLRGRDREALVGAVARGRTGRRPAAGGGLTLDGREVSVNFPAGVCDGQLIRLAGEGGEGRDGGSPGDLFLRIALRPHPRLSPTRR
jgi:curved DNA-binding protein